MLHKRESTYKWFCLTKEMDEARKTFVGCMKYVQKETCTFETHTYIGMFVMSSLIKRDDIHILKKLGNKINLIICPFPSDKSRSGVFIDGQGYCNKIEIILSNTPKFKPIQTKHSALTNILEGKANRTF